MNQLEPEKILREIPDFNKYSESVSRGIHQAVLDGGSQVRQAVDVLHGTWLGHPLHPVLTDFTLGAWFLGSVFDLIGVSNRSRRADQTADQLIMMGTISAVPTALSGLSDFSTITRRAMSTGGAHGLINTIAFVLYLLSSRSRKAGNRDSGRLLSSIALGLITVSAYLGGELTYKYGVGVNKSKKPSDPKEWKAVLDEAELPERQPRRVEIEDTPVLLYRADGQIFGIGAVCAHEGAPLEQGSFYDLCVECPWHQSVYDLRDGSVVHGPSTYQVPVYEARVQNGKVEVRLKES